MAELIDDNALLGADDDELDYDLEKDEEDALLADPDNENFDEQYEEVEANEEDVLDIDSNVRLDETEEDVGDQTLQENKVEESQPTLQEEDDEDFEEQKERNRFNNERNQNQAIHRLTSNEIPDCLEKVAVPPFNNPNNYQRNNNGRYHRGRGRGRGRNFNSHPGNNRPSVFGRVGNVPGQTENKKVLINPHFRGNVQVNENARLVWDPNSPAPNQQHPRFPNNQIIPVAPFQAHPSPWVVPPYPEQNNAFNQAHQVPHNYQDQPAQQQQYNQGPGQDLRPLMQMNNQFPHNQPMTNWCEETTYNCEPLYQSQTNFRGREVRFNQPNSQQVLINPQANFNQQTQRNFIQLPQQRPPLLNQPNIPPLLPMPQQPQQQHQQHQQQQQQQQQHFAVGQQNNQFMNQPHQHQQFPPQNQFQHQFPQQPVFGQHQQVQVYDYENSNQYQQNYGYNYAGPKPPQHANYQPAAPPNFNQMGGFQAGQEQFQQTQQCDNNRQFIRNENNQQRGNNRSFNPMNNRTPPKRRTFEPKNNNHPINSGERDLPKKKRRSLELSNLHQVPTVDMPDTTTEDKGEEEDEETKAYRKKIEEQKKLREKILQQKEERRKLAAANKQQTDQQTTNSNPKNQPNNNLITTIKTNKPIVAVKAKAPPQQQQQQQQQQNKRNLNQQKLQQQPQQQLQKKNNPANNVLQQQQNVIIRRRVNEQQSTPANIVITQKQQQQPQRIVMVKQPQTNQQSQPNKSNRRVILKGSNNKEILTTATATTNTNVVAKNEDSPNLSSFLSNRKVIAASAKSTAPSAGGDNKSFNINEGLIETPIVVVSNLAASTTDVKIRTMCQGLGPIQTIEMIPNSRQATITFKNILSAHKFFKKFHRKIIDLSMIQVTLEALT